MEMQGAENGALPPHGRQNRKQKMPGMVSRSNKRARGEQKPAQGHKAAGRV